MPGGRPTKYKPEFCERVIELGKEGKSRHQMAAALDVAMSTMQDWETAWPEFRAATTRAGNLAQAWWEDQGQLGLWSRDFNAAAHKHQIGCRFPETYRESKKVEVDGSIETKTTIDASALKTETLEDLLNNAPTDEE